MALAQLLQEQNFPAIAIHRAMTQEERLVKLTTDYIVLQIVLFSINNADGLIFSLTPVLATYFM